ncbi:MAG: rhodanese-like domain-containing protein [Proteobacteria bacterium]|nr:rhodanese-like domain-containing protein [Pseudomonadota bacterium]
MIKELTPPEASNMLANKTGALLIDVRSTMEYDYVGHPLNSIHIPIKEPPGWEVDTGFVDKVRKKLVEHEINEPTLEDTPLLLLCRSGKRSELAAQLLEKDGFKELYNVIEGFEGDKDENGHRNTLNGWRYHKLPWEQS